MIKKDICLGCNCIPEYLDMDAKAVLWINDYYMNKAKELHLYSEDVEQYVMPKFWQTKEEFCGAKDYCLNVYKIVIKELAGQLDIMHHTSFGEKGWDVLLWHWLEGYIEAFYDKYIRIRYAADNYPALYLKERDVWYIPKENDLPDSEQLQAQQYQDIYYFLYYNDMVVDTIEKQYEVIEPKLPETERNREPDKSVKHTIAGMLKKLICRNEVNLYIDTSYLAISKPLLELLSRGRIRKLELPQETMFRNIVSVDIRRKIKREKDYEDEFINLIYDCLWQHIPMKFVEDFQNHYEVFQELNLKKPVKIVDSNMIYNDILFQIYVAEALNHGGKLEIIQHGGNYCVEKYIRWWEFEIAYKYYAWGDGFVKNNKGNMCAMPVPKTLAVKIKKRKKRRNILFVGYKYRPYVACLWNLYVMKWEEVYRREDLFFQALNSESREKMRVRCYPNNPWWDRKDMLRQKFPWMRFDDNLNYYSSMLKAKLVVTSLIATTCMEAINCDIPTIILCSEDLFIPDENAVAILNELRKVQVLIDNPEDAADLINKNEERIEAWWNETERKAVVSRFRKMYTSRGCFPKVKWIKEMLQESKAVN